MINREASRFPTQPPYITATGGYLATGNVAVLGLDLITPAGCPEGSRSEHFLVFLSSDTPRQSLLWRIEDGNQRLELLDRSVLYFEPAE